MIEIGSKNLYDFMISKNFQTNKLTMFRRCKSVSRFVFINFYTVSKKITQI